MNGLEFVQIMIKEGTLRQEGGKYIGKSCYCDGQDVVVGDVGCEEDIKADAWVWESLGVWVDSIGILIHGHRYEIGTCITAVAIMREVERLAIMRGK